MAKLTRRTKQRLRRGAVSGAGLLVVAVLAVSADWAKLQEVFLDPEIFLDQFPEIIRVAAWHTLIFSFFGFIGGLVLGLVLALMRLSSVAPYRWAAAAYIEFFRGIPALVTILVVGQGIPIAFGYRVPGTYGAGSVALAIVAAAYMAESIRAGIQAVPRGQVEAARSLGMSQSRALVSIVLPQAFRIMTPPLTNELVLLVKDTSLISVLGVTSENIELLKFAKSGMQETFNLTPLTAAALVYFMITFPLTRAAAALERRGQAGGRGERRRLRSPKRPMAVLADG